MHQAAAVALLLAASLPASAAVITFEGPPADYFRGADTATEAGFVYSVASGSLYVSADTGNPGKDIEGDGAGGGGVLRIVAADGSLFRLLGLDFAAYDSDLTGAPSGSLTATGLRGGTAVGSDRYSLPASDTFPYGNWTSERPSALAGLQIDTLLITLPASNGDIGTGSMTQSWSGLDNVVLRIPVPASLVLFGSGLAALGIAAARRHS